MEKIAVDLDKVLDEFEKNEEKEGTPSRQPTSQTSLTTFLHNLDPIAPPQAQQPPTSALLSPSFESLFTPGTKAPSQVMEDSKAASAKPSEVSLHCVPEITQNHHTIVEKTKIEEGKLEGALEDKISANKEHSPPPKENMWNGSQLAPVVNGIPPDRQDEDQDEQTISSTEEEPCPNEDEVDGETKSFTFRRMNYVPLSLFDDEGVLVDEVPPKSQPLKPEEDSQDLEDTAVKKKESDLGAPQEPLTEPIPPKSPSQSELPAEAQPTRQDQETSLPTETTQCASPLCDDLPSSKAPQSDLEFLGTESDQEIREHVLVFKKSKERLDEGECKMRDEEESLENEEEVQPLGFSKITEEECTTDNLRELESYFEETHHNVSSSSSDSLEPLVEPSPESDTPQETTVQVAAVQIKTQLQVDEEEDEGLQSAESPSQEEGCSTGEDVEESTSTEEEGPSPGKSVEASEVERGEHQSVGDNSYAEARVPRPTFLNLPESQGSLPPMEVPPAEPQLGRVKPVWVPDSEARNCMLCNSKFTVIRRRHHCRTCGKVLCSQCCNHRTRLPYLQNKEGRVCQPCFLLLSQESAVPPEGINSPGLTPFHGWTPSPNHPQEYCSTLPPHQQVSPRAPPTVMVPVGVLKNNSVRTGQSPQSGEPKQVMFSDGIRPGGDLQDNGLPLPPVVPRGRHTTMVGPKAACHRKPHRAMVADSEGSLPPLVLPSDVPSNFKPDPLELFNMLQDVKTGPICFALTKNLFAEVKLVTLSCCLGPRCWSVASQGLRAVGQDEVLLVLEREPDEHAIPRCAFNLLRRLWDDASRGQPATADLGHVLFPEGLFGSRENSGFLLVRPTFQCLDRLFLPSPPFLLAILIQRWEVPWAKVFPLRLALRLGAEFRRYPCPAVSCRSRKPVYGEVGHTIMSVLADLRNFQFTVPVVPGVVIHMQEGGATEVRLPRNRWEAVRRLLAANEHVVALGGNFSSMADSHLVCFQREDGSYHTQAINIQNTSRKVIGASFIVFSGALKSVRGGPTAKVGLVEDGLLVQLSAESLASLRTALRAMDDFSLTAAGDDTVALTWVQDDRAVNIGVKSPIDDRPLDGVESVRIHTATDFASHHLLIRWTEVFFFRDEGEVVTRSDGPDPGRVAEAAAEAFCQAVAPHLGNMGSGGTRVGLRLSLGADKVEFECGASGRPLPPSVLPALDTALIPLMSAPPGGASLLLELHFHILFK